MKISTSIGLLLLAHASLTSAEVRLERVPEHGVQPQVAVAADGTVHLVYLVGKPEASDVHYCFRSAKATAWSVPQTVNTLAGTAMAMGTIRGAQLAVAGEKVHVVWNGKPVAGENATAPLYYTRLDKGKFSEQKSLNTGTRHLDGGASVAASANGSVRVVWHAQSPQGKTEADRQVYLSHSSDAGVTFSPPQPAAGVAAGVCPCCSLKALSTADGGLSILYRTATTPNQRPMTLLTSADGVTFQPKTLHPWPTAACPMSSGAMLTAEKATQSAWETQGQIFYANSPQSQPTLVSTGKARHPAIARNASGQTLVSWSIGTGWQKGGELGWAVLDKAGQPTAEHGTAKDVPVWSHTAVIPAGEQDFIILH